MDEQMLRNVQSLRSQLTDRARGMVKLLKDEQFTSRATASPLIGGAAVEFFGGVAEGMIHLAQALLILEIAVREGKEDFLNQEIRFFLRQSEVTLDGYIDLMDKLRQKAGV